MRRAEEFFHALTAGDVMGRAMVVPRGMSVVTAARLLAGRRLHVALVTDAHGRCVGVFSEADFLRWVAGEGRADEGGDAPTACAWSDWQVLDAESTRRGEVGRHMTCDPLLVTPDTPLAEIAEVVLDPRRCPVVVVDGQRRPLGVVSSKDVLAALASGERRPDEAPPAKACEGRRSPLRRSVQPLGRT